MELLWHLPESGDPKIYYKVGPQLKDKLHLSIFNVHDCSFVVQHVFFDTYTSIPSATFGKICKILFLVDEGDRSLKVPAPLVDPHSLNSADSSDHEDSDSDLSRSSSTGEIPVVALTPRIFDGFTPRPVEPTKPAGRFHYPYSFSCYLSLNAFQQIPIISTMIKTSQ